MPCTTQMGVLTSTRMRAAKRAETDGDLRASLPRRPAARSSTVSTRLRRTYVTRLIKPTVHASLTVWTTLSRNTRRSHSPVRRRLYGRRHEWTEERRCLQRRGGRQRCGGRIS